LRPGVVWFGEALPQGPWQAALEAVTTCDLLLVVGTSGLVHPAAGLPAQALARGVPVVEINPQPTPLSGQVSRVWRTTAAVGLPALVGEVGNSTRA
jgi:NAD-dependent deacetylase